MKGIFDGAFTTDDRAVAPVLGVALLFAIAAIGLSMWQTAVIPQQNAEVEFNHYSEIQEDVEDLRGAHQETVNTGKPQSPTLRLGTTYRSRIIGVNPPNPQGNLESHGLGRFRLEDAPAATSDTEVKTEDVCGVNQPKSDELRYAPGYNRLSDEDTPPISYESTVVYRETADGDLLLESDQLLIQGSNINILPVQSEAQRSSRTTTLTLASEGYEVEKRLADDAAPDLIVPTNIPASTWKNDLLDTEVSEGYVNDVTEVPDENAVRIDLAETPGQFPWTVRCAITTDGESTAIRRNVDTPPRIKNGGVGQGGITEHTVDSNEDELVIPNGKWIEVDSIAKILMGPSETTSVSHNSFNSGEGIVVEFKVDDGESDETVFVRMGIVKSNDDGWNDKKVQMYADPNNCCQGKDLTASAARDILETGEPDILNPDNYAMDSDTFSTDSGSFGSYVEDIKQMENATIYITDLQGRVDMEVVSGELSLDIADDDESQYYEKKSTDEITFNVTATGVTDDPENVDLVIKQDGSYAAGTKPREDRYTLSGLDGGSEEFTLTWEPDWGDLNGGSYEIKVKGESDTAFGTVEILDNNTAYVTAEIADTNSPVEYGDDLTTDVRLTNEGDTDKDIQVDLSLDGNGIKQKQGIHVDPGETKTVTLTKDTGSLDTDAIGEGTLKAKTSWDDDTETITIEEPTIILEPTVEDVRAGEERLNHTMGFTLGEDLDSGAEIKIDLTDTGTAIRHDGNSGNWTILKGDGQVSLNTNNNRVTSVKYQTGSADGEGNEIVLVGDYTNTEGADPGILYDVEYELTSANNYPQGQTNSTTFETT